MTPGLFLLRRAFEKKMYNKRWIYKDNKNDASEYMAKFIAERYSLPLFAARICVSRGLKTPEDAERFFTRGTEKLTDPYKMKGMDEAVERITEAVDNGETITIFGDYDADGVTATAILYSFLTKQTDATVYFRIPDRLKEGYGLSETAVREISEDGTKLIVTVDCGIKSVEEIQLASELGIDVVVTDHHTRGDILPLCCAIVNPIFEPDDSPLKNLCGAGVSYKLCEALGGVFGCEDDELYPLLAQAAVGTLGDAVSLTGENRTIVNCGIEYIKKGYNIGLTALLSGEKNYDPEKLTAKDISYTVVPKINAAGRMGDASRALELLTTPDKPYAEKLAEELSKENIKRKEIETQIFSVAYNEDHLISNEDDCAVVSLGEGWHHGVMGIVAARIMEKSLKPAFLFAPEDDDPTIARGSARSVDGFDLRQALAYCGEFIEKFGGHEKAAGLTVKVANLRPFLDKLNEYYRDRKNETVQVKTQTVDCILPAWEITPENFESLRKLEPFGTDNEDPKICTNDVELCDIRYMSEGKHARFTFKALDAGGKPFIFTAKKFNIEGMPLPWPGERCSILYKADVNVWNGRKTAEPVIEDIFENAFCVENECKKIYNENCITHSGFYVKREDLVILFKVFRATGGRCDTQGINGLLKKIRDAGYGLTRYQIVYGMQIFRELGFVKLEKGVFETVPDAPSRSLEESEIFTSLSE